MSHMLDQGNRTFISSVVFVDIVHYSQKSVSEQILIKDRFTALLTDALKDTAPEQRIILDTGDGAAISFLGDPEDALFVAMHMRDVLKRASVEQGITTAILADADTAKDAADLRLRIGVNLGPIKLVRDINGQPNIVGDGINVAQRIMSFALPGQIVTTRSYYDVVSVISAEYAKLFKFDGSRTDKHVREHEIYIVGDSVEAFNQAKAGIADRAATTNPPNPRAYSPHNVPNATGVGMTRAPLLQNAKLKWIGAGLFAVVLALFGAYNVTKPGKPTEVALTPTTSPLPPVAASQPASKLPASISPTLGNAQPSPGASQQTKSATSAQGMGAETKVAAPSLLPPLGQVVKPQTEAKTVGGTALTAPPTPPKPATLTFEVKPWGAVFLDGKPLGDTPPLKAFQLPAGRHKIEVKNGNLPQFVTTVDLKAGETLTLRHVFQ